ncbi:MAG: nuclear transport factor 2 family protein [Actinomycetota bacterium]
MAGTQPFDRSGETADRLALLQVEADYARTWDCRDAAAWAALFTEDGAFELAGFAGERSYRFEGRERLTRFCEKVSARQDGIHLLAAPSLTIDGPTATGWVHFQYFDRNRETGVQRHVLGVYAVTYVRSDAEGWRMRLRREQPVAIDDHFGDFPTASRMWGADLA